MTRTRPPDRARQATAASSPMPAPAREVSGCWAPIRSLPEAEGVDTIGGLVTAVAGRVPTRGEIVTGPGEFEFEVLDADPRRVKRLKIRPLSAHGVAPPAASAGKPKPIEESP